MTTYIVEHQRPYGQVVGRTKHTSPACVLRRYRQCLRKPGSAVFILRDGKEIQPSDLR